jgi:hypothetical protein
MGSTLAPIALLILAQITTKGIVSYTTKRLGDVSPVFFKFDDTYRG